MKRPAKTCSKKCADALTAQGSSVTRTCELCNKEFSTSNRRARFCNDTHTLTCIVCSQEFALYNPHKPAQTCSKKCAWKLVDSDEVVEKRKKSTMDHYGVENPSQAEEVKRKKQEKSQERYGVKNVSQADEVKMKRTETLLREYGVENAMHSEEIKTSLIATMQEKYGVDNPFQLPEFQEKAKATLQEKYGVDNISRSELHRKKVKTTTWEKYGVTSVLALPENQKKSSETNKYRISKLNKKWKKILEKATDLPVSLEERIGDSGYYADLRVDDKLFIDINPTATHNSSVHYGHLTKRCSNMEHCVNPHHQPIASDYHQNRALEAERQGEVLLQYFDWMSPAIFLSIVEAKLKLTPNRIPAKKTALHKITQAEANRFFRDNHLMGASNKQSFCVGLFYEGELVHVQSYGKSRMSKKYEWEAIRSCSLVGYQIIGGFTKCDSHFFKTVDPESVISYVDLSISQGHTDSMGSGWNQLTTNGPSATWVKISSGNSEYPRFIRDNTARRVSADRLLGYEVGDKYPRYAEDGSKITNDEVLLSEGYVKVYDAGTRSYGWTKE